MPKQPSKSPRWPDNLVSPVLFFVDDLSNTWIDINGDGRIQPEEDWGHAGLSPDGAFNFLQREILSVNSKIKVTFFVPVGVREPAIINSGVNRVALPMDQNHQSRSFFRFVHQNSQFELAYHGTTHGTAGSVSSDFKQEWETFNSLQQAIATIEIGKEIFKQAVDNLPKGGKYCGYKSNSFSDESIDKSGFLWWCRYWQPGAVEMHFSNPYETGVDQNPLTAYLPKFFGESQVVDIPSTLNPAQYGSLSQKRPISAFKVTLKRILRPYFKLQLRRKLDFFLQKRLVISIQEHISPAREDTLRQSPNIFDDKDVLCWILSYLKDKKVWYCTATELAQWSKGNRFSINDPLHSI